MAEDGERSQPDGLRADFAAPNGVFHGVTCGMSFGIE
jgi:hypothetical protein